MTVTPDYDVWLQPNHPVRRINMTFSPRLLPALTFALALIAPAQAATPSIAPLPSSLPKPTTPIYPLGKIDGAAVYATGVVSITDYTPGYTPDVCRSDKILIRAAKTDWTPSSARPIYLKAAHKLYHQICQGKMQPAWRQHLRGVVIDEASFQRLLIGQTQDEYLEHHPFYIPLPPEKYQAQQDAAQAQWQALKPKLQENESRLRALFKQYDISAWTPLYELDQNPFAYRGKVILSTARLQRALNASTVAVASPSHNGDYRPEVVLIQADASRWQAGVSQLVVVRVNGRYQDQDKERASAELLASWPCQDKLCDDQITVWDATPGLDQSPVRRLKTGERF